jgi:hypothetical protein
MGCTAVTIANASVVLHCHHVCNNAYRTDETAYPGPPSAQKSMQLKIGENATKSSNDTPPKKHLIMMKQA